jgi:hypothetical protein
MSEPKLSDLDRCLHGRHAIDNCLDCPGGWSLGNPYLADGQRIGTDLYGKPILVGQVRGPIKREPPPPTVPCDDAVNDPHEPHHYSTPGWPAPALMFCPGVVGNG